MYEARQSPRYLTVIGSFGMAGLGPPTEVVPAWLGVGVVVLPLLLYELGAGIADDARTERWIRRAYALQTTAAFVYVTLFFAAVGYRTQVPIKGFAVMATMATMGVAAAVIVVRDLVRLSAGFVPSVPDPIRAAERLDDRWGPTAQGGSAKDVLAVIGWTPIALFAVCLAFTLAALWLMSEGPTGPHAWLTALFFGSGALVGLWMALERWTAFVPHSSLHGVQALVRGLGLVGFTAAITLFGLFWPNMHTGLRVVMVAAGVLGLFAGVLQLGRRVFGWKVGVTLVATREGILEHRRQSTVLYPWEAVQAVSLGEIHHNVSIFVALDGASPYQVLSGRVRDKKLARKLRWNRNFMGADLVIMAAMVDGRLPDLHQQIAAALDDPTTRAELPLAESLVHG